MEIDEVLFAKLRDAFLAQWKRVEPYVNERRPLTKNEKLRVEYKEKLVQTFNAISTYLRSIYVKGNAQIKIGCVARIKPYIDKCKTAFCVLNLQYEWPKELLADIEISLISFVDGNSERDQQGVTDKNSEPSTSQTESASDKSSESQSAEPASSQQPSVGADSTAESEFFDIEEADDSQIDELIKELSLIDVSGEQTDLTVTEQSPNGSGQSTSEGEQVPDIQNQDQESRDRHDDPNFSQNVPNSNTNMPQSKSDFFKLADGHINYKYEGDPLKLEAFIEDIELIDEMAEEGNKATALKLIRTKVTGRAREYLPDKIDSVKDIVDALKRHIKPDSSQVIEGRLTALRVQKSNFTKFSEEAEKLAEAFRRSLVVEGFTREKAHELPIRKTKELCRRVTHSDVVKGIIASSTFDTPAEVIAKMITEGEVAQKEKKEKEMYEKRPNNKFNNNKKFGKGGKNNKEGGNFKSNKKFDRSQKQGQNNGQKKGNRNEHVIRLVTDAGASTSSDASAQSPTEQVFRYAPS